jgi:uncharacterized repeat protein (TIGR03803 family)
MRQNKFWSTMSGILVVLAVALMLPAGAAAASKYKVLYKFTGGADGGGPNGDLIFDAAGNLYGTTLGGAVFKLAPNADGSWTESVLYNVGYTFASVIFDAVGNLYGTSFYGGSYQGECFAQGCGFVFKLTPNSDGSWTESVLYNFDGYDGNNPKAGLIFDAAGNLYGTTEGGGVCFYCGVVFKLTPNSDGSWSESVLCSFGSNCTDGLNPQASLIFDAAGNLYGTAGGGNSSCGGDGCGIIFKLSPQPDGSWIESVPYSFCSVKNCADGRSPNGNLIFDQAGNLYGTTSGGGIANCCGVVFELTPKSDGSWTERVLHAFRSGGSAGLIFDTAGNLYGNGGGAGPAGDGAVFELAHNSSGSWTYSPLRFFFGKPAKDPVGGLVLDKAGNVYGTTFTCASGCAGAVFEITP